MAEGKDYTRTDSPSRARRPLPTPGAPPVQRPNTPIATPSPVAPASFYSSSTQKPPPLPSRPKGVGSSSTTYVSGTLSPPPYAMDDTTDTYREPEPITDEDVPSLVSNNDAWNISDNGSDLWNQKSGVMPYSGGGGWDNTNTDHWSNSGAQALHYDTQSRDWSGSSYNPSGYLSGRTSNDVPITGRNTDEELSWWDSKEREKHQRPGPGLLPPILADELHDSEHTLFSVTATMPEYNVNPPPPPTVEHPSGSLNAPPTSSPSSSPAASHKSHRSQATSPPTEEEVRHAVPHPNAYYCPKENGWVILSWKSSTVAPPLARSFQNSIHNPLPDQTQRKKTTNCLSEDELSFGLPNKTHHFHKYDKAVDALKLTPPYRVDEWETIETVKQKRRAGTIITQDLELGKAKAQDDDKMEEDEIEEEGQLLDLYVCCQCCFYCIGSPIIPGVIPKTLWNDLILQKKSNPPVGVAADEAVVLGIETIVVAIENLLWKGENRNIRIFRPGFQRKMGWSETVRLVFEAINFSIDTYQDEDALHPPTIDSSPQGKQNRVKLLRAWVEVSAWLTDYKRKSPAALKLGKHKLSVKIDSSREMYQTAVGAHPDQIERGSLSDTLMIAVQPFQKDWANLGLTPSTYSSDLLAFGYYAQCRCDPAHTIEYFTSFSKIVKIMQDHASCPDNLTEMLALESSRDRFTSDNIAEAASHLGFGSEGPLRVDYDADIPDEFIENAWRDCVKRSWHEFDGTDIQRRVNEALRIIAEARGSAALRHLWETSKDRLMNPDKAYDTLEVAKDVDDLMLITVFGYRVEEQPLQAEKWREALLVIAEVRESERLRQFLGSGRDPGDIIAPTRPDWPRGLNQLGNTCYLNSLLQYFYTIKDLREAVLTMHKLDTKSFEDDKVTDDDLKRHRVGGRLVTRREIVRSKRFITQLADLFVNLEYSDTPAITPTIDLAKLALVTSKDEEDDEADTGGTEASNGSNDTDATLVEDGPLRVSVSEPPPSAPQSPSRSPGSVLGKRPRDMKRQRSEMDVDITPLEPQDSFSMVMSPPRSTSPPQQGSSSKLPAASASTSSRDKDGDVEMRTASPVPTKPPPLPPRKTTDVSDSAMMFGKQHDVAECMDNCMFQIETALLKFDGGMSNSQDEGDKTSVVKRLFYGKTRQILGVPPNHNKSRAPIEPKVDFFSHLLVNVAEDGFDLYDGLGRYFDDIVEYEGEKVPMQLSLVDLPPLLQVQLQRVQFDRDTLQSWKSQAYVKFGETIYMDRFMDNADPQKRAQSKAIQDELNTCRERIRMLTRGKDGPITTVLDNTREFLSRLEGIDLPEIDDELVLQLSQEQGLVQTEIDDLRTRMGQLKEKLEDIWRDDTQVAYELTSVFIHRGTSPSWGHYFFYSRHLPDAPDEWFKYNDSDVSVISKEEVLADTTGSTANPYLLVFARKGSEVVDTVKRFDTSSIVDGYD